MNSVRKALKIKDKDLKSLQYIASTASKRDTIILEDTIFKKIDERGSLLLDTVVENTWYSS